MPGLDTKLDLPLGGCVARPCLLSWPFSTGSTNVTLDHGITLSSYISQRLKAADPLYLELGPDVLDRAIDIAQRWAQEEIERQRSAPPYPPKELLKERVSVSMVESGRPLPYSGTEIKFETDDGETIVMGAMDAGNRDWERIKLRMLPGDELWTYNGLDESWEYLAKARAAGGPPTPTTIIRAATHAGP